MPDDKADILRRASLVVEQLPDEARFSIAQVPDTQPVRVSPRCWELENSVRSKMEDHRRKVNFDAEPEAGQEPPCGRDSLQPSLSDGGQTSRAGKSKMELFKEAFVEKASNFQSLLRLRASAAQAATSTQESGCQPKQRAIALQPNRRASVADRSKSVEEATMSDIVTQRHSDRVVRERIQAVPAHLKALVSKAELDILQDLFESSDMDGSGLIGVEELPEMLKILGLNPLEFAIRELLKNFDTSSDGELNFGEFVSLWYSYREQRGKEDDTLETAFTFFDTNRSNRIDRDEFMSAMLELGDPPLTADEVTRFFAIVDADNSGVITKDTFLQFCGHEASMDPSPFDNSAP